MENEGVAIRFDFLAAFYVKLVLRIFYPSTSQNRAIPVLFLTRGR